VIYNFRFDRSKQADVLHRIRDDKILSQGWGGGETCDLRVDQEDFVGKCKANYHLASTRVPTSLTRIRGFKDGDLLVTPHLPDHGKVSIHVVAGDFPKCYDYRKDDTTHQNHRIRLKESYGSDGSISIHNILLVPWYAKLSWLRLPIMDIARFDASFQSIIQELRVRPDARFEVSKLDEYFQKLRRELLGTLREKLAVLSPVGAAISFEAVCERLLTLGGFRILDRHQYDRAGGDIDLRCVRDRSDASPFEAGQTVLFVQVKKHIGTTDLGAVQQLVKMIAKEPGADGCVMSLADNFSAEAVALAGTEIQLLNGEEICELLLDNLAGHSPAPA
jgi:hypothetical protein